MRRDTDEQSGRQAQALIDKLELRPHPEGGWFRETWRDTGNVGGRPQGTAILFLLEAGQRSHWHKIDASELWIHQGGGALRLLTYTDGHVTDRRLGPDHLADDQPQAVVEPNVWQAAETVADWALVACIVVPGFENSGFQLARPGWDPTRHAADSIGTDEDFI